MRTKPIWLGLWACILTVGIAAPLWADDPKPIPKEFAWIPADSAGVLHIRFAELWNSAIGKNVVKMINTFDPKAIAEIEQEFGLSFSRIDRISVVVPTVGERNPAESAVIRITTTKPYDRRDILAAMRIEPDKGPPRANVDLYPLPGRGMLHFSDEKSITIIPKTEGAYSLLSGMLSKAKTGGISPALALAAEKNQVVVSIDITKLPRIPLDEIPPAMRPLFDAKTVTFIGNLLADTATGELRFTFGSKEDAVEGKQALEEGIKLALKFLDQGEQELNRAKGPLLFGLEIMKELRVALTAVKIEQTDMMVKAAAHISAAQIVSRVMADGAQAIKANVNRTKSTNNLKQMSLALMNYAATYRDNLPPAAICDKNGKPLLSWRVAILPYIEQTQLYQQFKLDEPWDSENNIKLIKQMPPIYILPGETKKYEMPSTYYQAFVGPHSAFEPKVQVKFPQSFTDGTSNTIWLAEAETAVPWTKPEDITYDPKKMPKVGFHYGDRCNVGFADGSVRAIKKTVDESIWHLLIQRDDGQVIPKYDD